VNTHYSRSTGELHTILPERMARWISEGNPKADEYLPLPPVPEHDPSTHTAQWGGLNAWVVEPKQPAAPPESVPAHHFKIALELRGWTDRVEAWVATKPRVYQIAYAETPTFSPSSMWIAEAKAEIGISDDELAAVWATARQVRT
jgi:hypothetical protein